MTSIPSANIAPRTSFGNWGEGAFDGVGRPQVFPVLGREVVESEQRVSILAQAVGRLPVFQRVASRFWDFR